jgi:hypothetical protein
MSSGGLVISAIAGFVVLFLLVEVLLAAAQIETPSRRTD